MINLCDSYNLTKFIKEPTCFKSLHNPTSIDVILTNRGNLFQNSLCFETGMSDHHKRTIAVLKSQFERLETIKIEYRKYKTFDLSSFKSDLAQIKSNQNIYLHGHKIHNFRKVKCVLNL